MAFDKNDRPQLNSKGFVVNLIQSRWNFMCQDSDEADVKMMAQDVCNVLGFE